jgi:predicted ribosome quality control (RQC) complex YloA/Tae2 family protein
MMERRKLSGGRLVGASYDAMERRLEIEFAGGEVKAYKDVPAEVWRRLVAAPNPAVFYADRIEEEYVTERGRVVRAADARARLDALFSNPDRKD